MHSKVTWHQCKSNNHCFFHLKKIRTALDKLKEAQLLLGWPPLYLMIMALYKCVYYYYYYYYFSITYCAENCTLWLLLSTLLWHIQNIKMQSFRKQVNKSMQKYTVAHNTCNPVVDVPFIWWHIDKFIVHV